MFNWKSVVVIFCACLVCGGARKVLLLSFDGFRWDYVDHFSTPNLDSLAAGGVHAPHGITTTFPPNTFPAHYTIATGLHAESHGIVNNAMYDPVSKSTFSMRSTEQEWWGGGEPIWITATLQNVRTGIFFWPGSDVELKGVKPYYWKQYMQTVPFEERIDTIIDWMVNDDVRFAATYFHEPDKSGHRFGALSDNVDHAVQEVDYLIGYLIEKLQANDLYDTTDVIVVSDHGMADITVDGDHIIVLSDFEGVVANIQEMPDKGAVVNILPVPGMDSYILERLTNAHPHMRGYLKEDVPERLHYSGHRRILPVVLFADEGYYIIKEPQRQHSGLVSWPVEAADHGYDNQLPSMRPVFFARGPSFKPGHKLNSTYETVNIYPLLCHLLGIHPAPNNGTLMANREMLVGSAPSRNLSYYCVTIFMLLWKIIF